ncbi:MAG TPA: hypothetical protein VE594_01090 [Nitrososphaeraceae archaeon]|jgi:hypothetical protein|nr:hypothetical protein [Nitrososphaeraceae archaeon]
MTLFHITNYMQYQKQPEYCQTRLHKRELYCPQCDRWLDRDIVAVMNISKGAHESVRSKGVVGEAMKGNPFPLKKEVEEVILRVDATKLTVK